MPKSYPYIDIKKTGKNIEYLRKINKMSVKDLQEELGFESPQAIYKWQWGQSLPTIDNLVILAKLFKVTLDKIIIISEN